VPSISSSAGITPTYSRKKFYAENNPFAFISPGAFLPHLIEHFMEFTGILHEQWSKMLW
jgi:hypothetical protein